MKSNMHIVFAGGGSVGHLMPGLAVAQVLRNAQASKKIAITFAGSGKPLEERLVRDAGFEYLPIASRPLPQSVSQAWQFVRTHLSGRRIAAKYLRQKQVAAVVGLGGYASVPMARAAIKCEVPLVLLEQNAVPGKATRWLAAHAEAVCLAFASAQAKLSTNAAIHLTGTPVRCEFLQQAPTKHSSFLNIMVLGGSAGSRVLNESVPKAIFKALRQGCRLKVVHQAGDGATVAVRELYRRFGVTATVSAFFDNLPQRIADADLVISRAGGTTIAELACAGRPAILVPYERATDNHQRVNAAELAKQHAALVIDPIDETTRFEDRLAAELIRCHGRPEVRQQLAQNLLELAQPQAANQVARLIYRIAKQQMLAAV
jgi:UDP-N-acetylglucosamine--N-acetylmuramyl-(pentapeptide) pyrophosphoryl-undecaprenol N-acetylglucosamine transferase